METIGDRIRKRRKELGLTQGEVAKRAGLGTGTISDMENGRQRETTKPVEVARALGVRVEWLTTGSGLAVGPEGSYMVRDEPRLPVSHSVHGIQVSREGAEIGAEWDKIQGDEYRQLARDFIYGLVAAQKRASRLPTLPLVDEKEAKNKQKTRPLRS